MLLTIELPLEFNVMGFFTIENALVPTVLTKLIKYAAIDQVCEKRIISVFHIVDDWNYSDKLGPTRSVRAGLEPVMITFLLRIDVTNLLFNIEKYPTSILLKFIQESDA